MVFHITEAQSNQYAMYYALFSQLVRLDLNDESLQTIIGDAAESWEISPDATVITFKLRPGITWHDGTAFTAADVAYTATWASQNRAGFIGFPPSWWAIKGTDEAQKACDEAGGATAQADPAKCGGLAANLLPGIKIIDDLTIEFTLAAPNALFVRNLADAPSSILPKHLLEGQVLDQIAKGDFKNEKPIGTGPFKMNRIVPGQFVEMDAYDGYFKGRPILDKLFYKEVTPEQAFAQLETGELDIFLNAGAAAIDRLSAMSNINVQQISSPGIYSIGFTAETPEERAKYGAKPNMAPGYGFWIKELRQALYYGIDRRGINDAIYGGRNKILWLPPGIQNYNFSGMNEYPYDVAKAKELIEAAKAKGLDTSKPIKVLANVDLVDTGRIAPIVVEQIEALGLTVDLKAIDGATWEPIVTDESQRDTWDLGFGAGGSEGLHASRSEIYYLCDQPLFSTGYYNCELRQLFKDALTKGDPAEQAAVYEKIAKILNEEVPQLYLWQNTGIHGVNKRVQGVKVPSFERYVGMNVETWSVTQ
ncbi:MAG: ABC transporter substrate-binding protein [Gammaproteobacteria bacterium]|nr:ABC transporter substrate-binding protein [Gammaproteobacteria bacterium]